MSLLDEASLVQIPSGYKEDKLYSIIPSDGSGDFNFSRASSATRVNADGLIEQVPYNLLQQSNQFNTTWTTTRASLTSGESGYDGSSNAWAMVDTTDNSTHLLVQTLTISEGKATFSVYAKAGAVDFIVFRFEGATVDYAYFDLSNGTIGTVDANYTNVKITDAGNGWYKCEATNESVDKAVILSAQSDNDPTYAGAGTTAIYIQDAQVNIGSTAKPYFPTTDRLNVPRIDYTGGGCGSLLLEKQSTNLITYSEAFDNAAWNKSGASVVSGKLSPSGDTNAFKLVENTANSLHFIESINIGGTGVKTFTIFVNAKEVSKIAIRDAFATGAYTSFDLATGSVITEFISNGTISQYGNDFYRISITQPSYTGNSRYQIFLLPDSYIGGSILGGYLGDGVSGLDIYGAQAEISSYSTSLINTAGATATRIADTASKTGISSLIGQTEGTMFVETTLQNIFDNKTLLRMGQSASFSNSHILQVINQKVYAESYVGGANQALIFTTAFSDGDKVKIGYAYKANDYVLYVNGVQIGTDTSASVPSSVGTLYVGNIAATEQHPIEQAQLYKTRLSNSELATLTTL